MSADREPRGRTRRQAEARGRRAETLARWLLRAKGYRILESRFRSPVGELDIVARRRRTLVFVEVKARDDAAEAIRSITPQQRARITRAASAYLAAHPGLAGLDMRFDVMLAVPRRLPIHMRNAWME